MRSLFDAVLATFALASALALAGCAASPGGGAFDPGPATTPAEDAGQVSAPPSTQPTTPSGPACPTDAHGNPTIACASDADCGPCDLMHQVCDTAKSKCVNCTSTEQSRACGPTASCSNDACVNACPTSCATDADCGQCNGAHACNAGKCEQCSATHPCPAPQQCGRGGTCIVQCGTDGQGTCNADADCGGCGASTTCHVPLNGGAGTCAVPASGCDDLGNGVLVLPDPFSQVTNLCSDNSDCAGIGVEYNVGKLLRDLTGISAIHDANVFYGMNACASVTLSLGNASLSCGLCVPCQVDADCQNINVDQVASQALGPLGDLAANFVLDEVFGSNDHEIHMYCDPIAGSYGACVPCPGVVTACGAN